MDDDDTRTSDDDDTKPPSGPLSEDVAVVPAPVIGSTEMASPWGPSELLLAEEFKRWPGSRNIRLNYKFFMEGFPDMVNALVTAYNLPDVEALALFAAAKTDSLFLNDVLRGNVEMYEEWTGEEVEMVDVIGQLAVKALERLPSIGGSVLWRGTGLPRESIDNLMDENYFYDPGFLSTSFNSKVAAQYASINPDGYACILQIICPPPGAPLPPCRGKDVRGFAGGKEVVLFPPGTKFAKVGEGWMDLDTETEGQRSLYAFVLQPWL